MQQERRTTVLRSVVEKYIETHEPVASATVAKDFPIRVSSATIRNDMAALEGEGYLEEPHTSAGRVPTEKGYRYFVDRLMTIAPLSAAQVHGIVSSLNQSASLEEMLRRAARLLAQITGQLAVVASPTLGQSRLLRFELVSMGNRMFLVILITDGGHVEQRTFLSQAAPCDEECSLFINAVNQACLHAPISLLGKNIERMAAEATFSPYRGFVLQVSRVMSRMSDETSSDGMYFAGVSQLTAATGASDLGPLLDALEEQVVVMRLMTAVSRSSAADGVGVAIGSETHSVELANASVVSSMYGVGAADDSAGDERPLAFVGSIGPTHMNYSATMAAVKAVAEYLSSFVTRQGF
ncbi:MAG: heat-inducible transcriptional repressor HrcA [Bifidobacteriaceae bacterium]|nr:heat-inducible transcriptional repressor HrcA [Bifidobacteriaceae bacterium]